MENKISTKEVFEAGISLSKKAAQRLSAVMEAEGKKRFRLKDESDYRWMFWDEL